VSGPGSPRGMEEEGSARDLIVRAATLAALLVVAVAAHSASPAHAAIGPYFDVRAAWGDTDLAPGGSGQFEVQVRNVGDADATEEELSITDHLPPGVMATSVRWDGRFGDFSALCTGVGSDTVTCNIPKELSSLVPLLLPAPGPIASGLIGATSAEPTGYAHTLFIDVAIDPGVSGSGINSATVEGGGAPPASDTDHVPFSAAPSKFGLVPSSFEADAYDADFPFGSPARQAGDRPFEQRVNFELTMKTGISEFDGGRYTVPTGGVRTVEVTLPRGMIGNPQATPKCDPVDFSQDGSLGGGGSSTSCPADTQIGYLNAAIKEGTKRNGRGQWYNARTVLSRVPLYNLVPPKGQLADFAFNAGGLVQAHIYSGIDPSQNYAVRVVTPNISSLVQVQSAEATIWGVPGDPEHDKFRFFSKKQPGDIALGAPWGSAPIRPLLTNPTDCGFDNGGARIRVDSYSHTGEFTPAEEWKHPLNVVGCNDPRFRFEPSVSLQPTSRAAGGPTGLQVHLKIPQRNDEVAEARELYAANGFVKGIATPMLKKAVVTLPQGMTVSPSAAQGLASCSPSQIGMGTDSPVTCPDASQFGTLNLRTPLLPVNEQPEGFIYVAKPFENPSHNFVAFYLVVQELNRGILVKLVGKADLDPHTGQITLSFDDQPQFPMEEMTLSIKSGLRAGLVNPQTCGKKVLSADFYTWQDPQTPHHTSSSYDIVQNPDGSPCHNSLSERPFRPTLSGGTVNNLAGAYSPTEVRLSRTDEDQELAEVEGTAPPGLLASIKGVGRCSDAAIAAAGSPERTGTEEIERPSCPADSLVGTVDAGSGVGQVLTYVSGRIYLAGPYKGAPVSGVAIVPAVAGPFDLGTIVARAPAYINPQTAELHLKTDPLPSIFKGVPVRLRDIRINLDRPHFTLNPTSCQPFALSGTMFSTEGKQMNGGSRFQAADCASLGFAPRLQIRLFGGTGRGSHPKFRATYLGREGDANVASAVATLPRSAFLDQHNIRTVCTRPEFAASACPAASIYGHATARTPLLDETLQGPIYLRSSNHTLPDLVADLHGIVDVEVDARIDSLKGGIRASFESIPDVPVESLTIAMKGGSRGLLVNSRSLCAHDYRAVAQLKAQNGKKATLRPRLSAKCSPHAARAKHHAKRARARGR
jgi:uncharacterized repeat protein (TIGR01451 family)